MSESGGAASPERPGDFFPVVYDELKRLVGECSGHSLNATALVHEAYLRLGEATFPDRSGFFRGTAFREWAYARFWLATALGTGP
jgi:hypothetical protein